MRVIDRTSLNLLALLMGGAGLFVVLTKFNVPELTMSFFEQSPFAIKRGAIDNAMTWLFACVTLAGLLIRVTVEVVGEEIPARLYSKRFYLSLCVVGLCLIATLVWGLTRVGYKLARRNWLPKVVENQTDLFQLSKFIIEHDGLIEQQWTMRDRISEADLKKFQRTNLEQADRGLKQIEKLIELSPIDGNLEARVEVLKKFWSEKEEL